MLPAFRRMTYVLCLFLICAACVESCVADSTSTKERTVTKLADGIYEIRHPDAPDGFPQSNTTVIIGERSVLVVDSCLLPSTARQDVEQIRTWTKLPVTYLVNTHWHFDHTLGNQTYAEAFPNIQIIAQKATQKIIADFNPGAVTGYHTRAERFQKVLDSGKNPDGTPLTEADRKDYEHALSGLGAVVEEFKTAHQLVPNVAFDSELDIDLGNRPVQVKFMGRGNTVGDAVVYLPKDRIVMTGDLVDHPVPYLFGGFPVDQVQTLQALAALDAGTIVPGHGDVLHDKTYVYLMIDLLKTVNAAMEKEVNNRKKLEEVQESFPKTFDVKTWSDRFAGNNAEDIQFFDQSFRGLVKRSFGQAENR
jgi:cyclase